MLYNKNNLSVVKMAAKNHPRPELNSVLFKKNLTCATDGVRLLEVSIPQMPPNVWPVVPDVPAMKGCKPFMVEAGALAEKVKPPRKPVLQVYENISIKHLDDHKAEFIVASDPESASVVAIRRVDGEFPDYERLFPNDYNAVAELTVNGALMSELLKVMSDLNEQVIIRFYGKDKPMTLQCKTGRQTARGLMMPIKV